ncbi:hypothetical protein CDL15_Pgr023991 [Punica granatum]|uniref:Uncharacterized protein n=1 Tax=Punica granatum TaxID=22663 RepID=A0A218XUJ1_PUNGR|nr:hypothetical protein CDL15_Pgr023991 [Punica granatum]
MDGDFKFVREPSGSMFRTVDVVMHHGGKFVRDPILRYDGGVVEVKKDEDIDKFTTAGVKAKEYKEVKEKCREVKKALSRKRMKRKCKEKSSYSTSKSIKKRGYAKEGSRTRQLLRGSTCLQGPWQHFPYADDLANMQVTPLGGIAFRPPPVRPSTMPHPRAPITKETIEGASVGTAQIYNSKGRRDGFDVTKDQTDVTEDRIDVTRDEFDVLRDELDVTKDEFNVPRDEFDVTRDEFDVTKDEFDVTRDKIDETRDELDVTRDEFNMIRDESDVTFFSGTQMMQLA